MNKLKGYGAFFLISQGSFYYLICFLTLICSSGIVPVRMCGKVWQVTCGSTGSLKDPGLEMNIVGWKLDGIHYMLEFS